MKAVCAFQASSQLSPGSSLRRRLHSIWRENSRDSENTSPPANADSPSSGSSSRCLSAIRTTSSATSGCTAGAGGGRSRYRPLVAADPCPSPPPPPRREGLGEEAELGTARAWTQPGLGDGMSSVVPRAAHAPWALLRQMLEPPLLPAGSPFKGREVVLAPLPEDRPEGAVAAGAALLQEVWWCSRDPHGCSGRQPLKVTVTSPWSLALGLPGHRQGA